MDAYFHDSGETTAAGKSTGKTPLLSLPLPPRDEASSPEPLPALYSTSTKALDKEAVTTMIPPRSSSLAYQPPVSGPPSAPSTVAWAPLTRAGTDFSLSLRHRDRDRVPRFLRQPQPVAQPTRLRSDSDSQPILAQRNSAVESDSPTNSLYSHRAVQLSSVLESPSFHRSSSFYGSGVLTSSTASALQAQDVANQSAATSVARSDEEGYVRVVIGNNNPLLHSPRHSHAQSHSYSQSYTRSQQATPAPTAAGAASSPPPLPPRSVARLQAHSDTQSQASSQRVEVSLSRTNIDVHQPGTTTTGIRSPRRAYQMGALRGRGMTTAPRTVSEAKAQGIKCADYYDSDYSDS